MDFKETGRREEESCEANFWKGVSKRQGTIGKNISHPRVWNLLKTLLILLVDRYKKEHDMDFKETERREEESRYFEVQSKFLKGCQQETRDYC
ncbi:hypothetical protein CFP56_024972 [Quercus suber]|uniref:Uncharacterized protein n=1 Tax=Quercus suber TaxID=58331 RepID=A0AAW0LZS0_QUESU